MFLTRFRAYLFYSVYVKKTYQAQVYASALNLNLK